MGRLDSTLDKVDSPASSTWRSDLIYWCVNRQVGGMQGRPNKDEDTCYSYWIGGTLRLLGKDDLLDITALREFVLSCQSAPTGGFGKVVGAFPDLLHSFYSMAWLSLSNSHFGDNEEDHFPIHGLNCTLGIRQSRVDTLIPGPELP